MTAVLLAPAVEVVKPAAVTPRPRRSRLPSIGATGAVGIIMAGHVALTLRLHNTVFEDEGLYIYQGHRVISHVLHGTFLSDYPGSYLSGAPGLYPVYAALFDNIGGLEAARIGSTLFTLLGIACVYGIGQRLFGRVAGVVGAAALAVCGPVVFVGHFATYDGAVVGLVALATWLAVRSAQREAMQSAPLVAIVLVVAAFTKYAAAVYMPMVFAVMAIVGWERHRWVAVRRSVFGLLCATTLFFVLLEVWARSLIDGLILTTANRRVLGHATPYDIVGHIVEWVGPWLALAALGAAFHARRRPLLMLTMLVASVIGPVDQVRIGESTSLSKHVAFGIVFAAPLIGELFAQLMHRWPVLAAASITPALCGLTLLGMHYSSAFYGDWSNETRLTAALRVDVPMLKDTPILGERPATERYMLERVTYGPQWYDTYYFKYKGLLGEAAYRAALSDHYFGLVYFDSTTPYGIFVQHWFARQPSRTGYYHLQTKVPRYFRGKWVGDWLVYVGDPRRASTINSAPLPATAAYGSTFEWHGTITGDMSSGPRFPDMFTENPVVQLWFRSNWTNQWSFVSVAHTEPARCALCYTWSVPIQMKESGSWQVRYAVDWPTVMLPSVGGTATVEVAPAVSGWTGGTLHVRAGTTVSRTITAKPGFQRQVMLYSRRCATCTWYRVGSPQPLGDADQTTIQFTVPAGYREWQLYLPAISTSQPYYTPILTTTR
jgi:hypothetical protein